MIRGGLPDRESIRRAALERRRRSRLGWTRLPASCVLTILLAGLEVLVFLYLMSAFAASVHLPNAGWAVVIRRVALMFSGLHLLLVGFLWSQYRRSRRPLPFVVAVGLLLLLQVFVSTVNRSARAQAPAMLVPVVVVS